MEESDHLKDHLRKCPDHGHRCHVCSMRLTSSLNLEKHYLRRHTNMLYAKLADPLSPDQFYPTLQCFTCGKTYHSRKGRARHVCQLKCAVKGCGKTFASKKLKKKHMEVDHKVAATKRKISCDVCHKVLTVQYYKEHQKIHERKRTCVKTLVESND